MYFLDAYITLQQRPTKDDRQPTLLSVTVEVVAAFVPKV